MKQTTSCTADVLETLKAIHSCHRAFSSSENWTTLDDEARAKTEQIIAHIENNKAQGASA